MGATILPYAQLSRRQFLKTSAFGGAMLVSLSMPGLGQAKSTGESSQWCLYVTIRPDNSVLMASPVMDMGQHMKTTGPMLLAEELDLDWQAIEFAEECPAYFNVDDDGNIGYAYADMGTGGSHALRRNWEYMRTAGATVRRMLLEEAASRWQVPVDSLTTKHSQVMHSASGRTFTYGQLAENAATHKVDVASLKLKEPEDFGIIGKATTTVDIHDIVTGKPLFGMDAEYPHMLHAVIARCPCIMGELHSKKRQAALAVNGVVTLVELPRHGDKYWDDSPKQIMAPGIAVIATSLWSAMQGKKALEAQWKSDANDQKHNSEAELAEFHRLVSDNDYAQTSGVSLKARRNEGDAKAALKQANIRLDATYEVPLFAHACMEPFNCIADIREDGATVVVGHQFPDRVAGQVVELTGLDPLKVEVRSRRMGGGFGRRWEIDFVREAVFLSKTLQQPVKITWMREDEVEQDQYAPAYVMRVRAGLDDSNRISAWHHTQAQTRGAGRDSCFPFKLVPNYLSEAFEYRSDIATGPWRGPGHMQWAFAAESMIDELAHAAHMDPLGFRMQLMRPHKAHEHDGWGANVIDSGRMAKCYERAAQMADWERPRPKGTGLGIAGHFTFGSYAAFVVEVSMGDNNECAINRAWGAIDCGLAVNPNHIENQMQGGFIDGLGAALFNKVNIEKGRATNNNFHRLRFIKMLEAPEQVEVSIIKNSYPPSGVGEPPTAPAAAALANAIYAASGKRIRRLPLGESVWI